MSSHDVLRMTGRLQADVRRNSRPGYLPGLSWYELPPGDPWTDTDPYTFTMAGDFTSIFTPGTKLRFKQVTASYKYQEVLYSTYSAPNTTVECSARGVAAYAFTVVGDPITDMALSRDHAPVGYPYDWLWPQVAHMWHSQSVVTVGNALSIGMDTAQEAAHSYRQSAAAVNDRFLNYCELAAGTYTFYVCGITGSNCGAVNFWIDGSAIVAAQDWYSASVVRNVIQSVASVDIPSSGRHTLSAWVGNKNALSSNYFAYFTWFAFR